MKKIISMLLVLATMLTVCMSLVACGGPKLDFKKAAKNLEKNDYSVEILDGDEYFHEREGALAIEEVLFAQSEDGDNNLVILKFDSRKSAKMMQKLLEEMYGTKGSNYKFTKYYLRKYGDDLDKDDRKALEKDLELMKECVVGRSGKYVWFGTENAIEDTKD